MRSPVKTAAIGRPVAYALSKSEQYELYRMKREKMEGAADDIYVFGIFKGLESGALPFVGVNIRSESNEQAVELFKEWCLVRHPSATVRHYDYEYLRGGSSFSDDIEEGGDFE